MAKQDTIDIIKANVYENENNEITGQGLQDTLLYITEDSYNTFAPQSTTYTKTETDAKLNLKADKATTYTKSQIDAMINAKENKGVCVVNGNNPDGVDIVVPQSGRNTANTSISMTQNILTIEAQSATSNKAANRIEITEDEIVLTGQKNILDSTSYYIKNRVRGIDPVNEIATVGDIPDTSNFVFNGENNKDVAISSTGDMAGIAWVGGSQGGNSIVCHADGVTIATTEPNDNITLQNMNGGKAYYGNSSESDNEIATIATTNKPLSYYYHFTPLDLNHRNIVYDAEVVNTTNYITINNIVNGATAKIIVYTNKDCNIYITGDNIINVTNTDFNLKAGQSEIIDLVVIDNKVYVTCHKDPLQSEVIVEFDIPSDNFTLSNPVTMTKLLDAKGYVTVDWGDGTTTTAGQEYDRYLNIPAHTFSKKGTYRITINDNNHIVRHIAFNNQSTKVLSAVNKFEMYGVTDLSNFGENQLNLTELPNDFIAPNLEQSVDMFFNASNITSVSPTLISSWKKATNINYLLQNTGLTSIDVDFLQGLTNLESVTTVFGGTYVPTISKYYYRNLPKLKNVGGQFYKHKVAPTIEADMFSLCPTVENIAYCFAQSYIDEIPQGLLDPLVNLKNASNLFAYTNITDYPSDLLYKNTKLENVSSMFNASKLAVVHPNTFDYCPDITNMSNLFKMNQITTIPSDIFKYNTKVTDVGGMFNDARNLDTLPNGLLENMPDLKNVLGMVRVTKITSIDKDFFVNNPQITNVDSLFASCYYLTSIPLELFRNQNNILRSDFMFEYCTNLNMNLDDFVSNINLSNVSNVNYMFRHCNKLTGTGQSLINALPANVLHKEALRNCTSLTDYDSLPSDWK
ncbi:BspA family leucine-rich repeat surface protein [Dysgonomonas sp. 520]|uniref:BspA family leucine-rich repeat surface protein n=1 Tax=Dysgonomonas sp. 520 TaxID=2302931 RepID=UPI0013D551A6|nr:BspA family leucine-rich repeat surface protein [Dysgonomonas sp. 520]